ncbi:MAG: septal ring lytic transglycosylase RlpA family protein [Solirubrobacterales bacterium]
MTTVWRWMRAAAVILALTVAACAEAPPLPEPAPPPPRPQSHGGTYKIGAPYRINGTLYTPKVDYGYDRTGEASWYGKAFHRRRTANGERFDENELTAAHQTLPMPSVVRVTNLENGRSLILRINDRGPFVGKRILDVSKKAAQLLGFHGSGTTKVRVTILEAESRALAEQYGEAEDARPSS